MYTHVHGIVTNVCSCVSQGPSAEPVVKCLLNEEDPFQLVDNYYQVPVSIQPVYTCTCVHSTLESLYIFSS